MLRNNQNIFDSQSIHASDMHSVSENTDDNYVYAKMMMTLLMAIKDKDLKRRTNWLGLPTIAHRWSPPDRSWERAW